MNRRCRVYVAGPLNADDASGYIKNVHKMLRAARELFERGFSPFVPADDLLLGIFTGAMSHDDYVTMNLPWVRVADAVLMLGRSPGVDVELREARSWGVPVFDNIEALATFWKHSLPIEPKSS